MKEILGEALRVRLPEKVEQEVRTRADQQKITPSEFLRQLVEAGLGKGHAPVVIQNGHGSPEELALFMGTVRELQEMFRSARSKLLVPRPVSTADAEAMAEWKADRKQVDDFLTETANCLQKMEAIADLLGALDSESIGILREWKVRFDQVVAAPGDKYDEKTKRLYKGFADWLGKAGL